MLGTSFSLPASTIGSRTQKNSGFALVTSLLVLVALSGLGVGAYFLTNTNLRIAENNRSSAIALYNAHEGLDVALIAIAQEFRKREDFSWPTVVEVRGRLPSGSPYEVSDLSMDPEVGGLIPGGVITVVGHGPRGARYETGARFEGQLAEFSPPGSGDPMFGTGWITDSDIIVNGNTEFSIGLWAGGNITGSGGAARVLTIAGFLQAAGNCSIAVVEVTGYPIEEFECKSGSSRPEIPTFNFDDGLADLQAERPTCDYTITGTASLSLTNTHRDKTICLAENARLTVSGTAQGLYIIGPRSSTVVLGVTANGTGDSVGVKMAAGTLTYPTSGNPKGFRLRGVNTIYTATTINLDEKSITTEGTRNASDIYVNTLFATEQNFKIKSVDGPFEGVIWANGSVCKQGGGGLSFVGSILAKGLGDTLGTPCTRGIYWNGGGGGTFKAVANDDIPDVGGGEDTTFEAAGILVVARRP